MTESLLSATFSDAHTARIHVPFERGTDWPIGGHRMRGTRTACDLMQTECTNCLVMDSLMHVVAEYHVQMPVHLQSCHPFMDVCCHPQLLMSKVSQKYAMPHGPCVNSLSLFPSPSFWSKFLWNICQLHHCLLQFSVSQVSSWMSFGSLKVGAHWLYWCSLML